MFVFEDILLLDDRSIQRVLRDVENADLELALKSLQRKYKMSYLGIFQNDLPL